MALPRRFTPVRIFMIVRHAKAPVGKSGSEFDSVSKVST